MGRTDRAWFSRLLRHPVRKQSGSVLTTPEPTRHPDQSESVTTAQRKYY